MIISCKALQCLRVDRASNFVHCAMCAIKTEQSATDCQDLEVLEMQAASAKFVRVIQIPHSPTLSNPPLFPRLICQYRPR